MGWPDVEKFIDSPFSIVCLLVFLFQDNPASEADQTDANIGDATIGRFRGHYTITTASPLHMPSSTPSRPRRPPYSRGRRDIDRESNWAQHRVYVECQWSRGRQPFMHMSIVYTAQPEHLPVR